MKQRDLLLWLIVAGLGALAYSAGQGKPAITTIPPDEKLWSNWLLSEV
jgi:hypothetical protein